MTINGKVKWFNPTKGYWIYFTRRRLQRCFCTFFSSKNAGLSGLAEGETLTFEVEEGAKGPAAVNLQKG